MDKQEWLLQRNCSLTPGQLGMAYVALSLMAFLVALIASWHGAWMILGFAVVEMAVVACAFLQYARHATDHEHIALLDNCLLIELVQAGKTQQTRLDRCWTRVFLPRDAQDLIGLQAGNRRVSVGRFVNGKMRQQVARELQQQLARCAAPSYQAAISPGSSPACA